jgi:uncharacterized repeat protein (TIGR03803 family)
MAPLAANAAKKERVLHEFHSGADGAFPVASLVIDNMGNLYGTTVAGGGGGECGNFTDCGTVFKVTRTGTETILHTFIGGCDGANPRSGFVMDDAGNMYGTTQIGGVCNNALGFGTVYKLTPSGTVSLLYIFQGGADGENPVGNLAADGQGDLYGAASGGDPNGCSGGCGLVFRVTPQGAKTDAYAFRGGADGQWPYGDVIIDTGGNIYGTTLSGGGSGCNGQGCGTVFKVAPNGTETVLYAFQGGADGWYPENGVVMDGAGNLYGTTETGGSSDAGTVFKVTPAGAHSVLYSFLGGADGGDPQAGVILDGSGNLYGTTYGGGTGKGCKSSGGCGVVFEVTPDGTETVLHTFDKNKNPHLGAYPAAALLLGRKGSLYGTTLKGGHHNNGVVFELKR